MTRNTRMNGRPNLPLLKRAALALVTAAAILLLVSPLLQYQFLPLADMPNHIARHYIASLDGSDPDISRYFEVTKGLVPNAAVDMILNFLDWTGDPYIVGRISIGFYIANFVISVLVLNRVVTGSWHYWPLTVALIAYNGNFYWGFENYLFTTPFAILGIALWLAIEGRPVWARTIIFTILAWCLFIMHLFAFAFFIIAIFGREIQVLIEQSPSLRRKYFVQRLPLALVALIPLAHLAYILAGSDNADGSLTMYGGWESRLLMLLSIVGGDETTGAAPSQFIFNAITLTFLAWVLLSLFSKQSRRLRISGKMLGPVIAVVVACFLMPIFLNGVAYAHIRFPFLFIALVIAGSGWKGYSKRQGVLFVAVVCSILIGRVWGFNELTRKNDAYVHNVLAVLDEMPEGSRLLPLVSSEFMQGRLFLHPDPYATISNHAFVPTIFQGAHMLKLKPEWKDFAHPWLSPLRVEVLALPIETQMEIIVKKNNIIMGYAYWLGWEKKFNYVIMLTPTSIDMETKFPLRLIKRINGISLYRVESPAPQ